MNASMKQRNSGKQYMKEFGGAMVLYAVTLIGVNYYYDNNPDTVRAWVLALLPMVPTLLAAWAIVRHIGRVDEMYRKLMTEAYAIGGVITALATFTYGFLEGIGLPQISMIWILPFYVMVSSFIIPILVKRQI